jgi:hypothetical protein
MSARSLAQEAAGWYLTHLEPTSPNAENVKAYLRGPVLALTLKVLNSPEGAVPGLEIEDEAAVEEEKKSGGEGTESSWRKYLHPLGDDSDVAIWDEQDQDAYDALGRRTRARMEAFLASCCLALPDMSRPRPKMKDTNKIPKKPAAQPKEVSLSEGLSGFRVSVNGNKSASSSPTLASIQASTALLRQISVSSTSSSAKPLPQFSASDLTTRLELYIRTLHRVRTLGRECVVTAEPPRALKARAQSLVMSFVATVGCVRSMGPSLTRLLECMTKELLAEDCLGEGVSNVIQRVAIEYEHQTSFASLAFLSSPEVSAQTNLTPMIMSYLRHLQRNWQSLESECEVERMLSTVIDGQMRSMFKTIEFRSIGHLLEVCQEFRNELHTIELPPDMGGISNEDVTTLCKDVNAVKQAIRDLQREILTVNGHVLPPVDSRKELVHLLSQTLNSRTLTASHASKRKIKSIVSPRRSESCPSIVSMHKENADPMSELDSDGFISSGNEGDSDSSSMSEPRVRTKKGSRQRSQFHLSTVDLMTRRLLIASSRTGQGGDAYFIVRDLFGGEDVEVVPSASLPNYGRMAKGGTIEILVRLASVTIKCHGSFDVYPKSLVGEVEPLIQLHTTTTETICLQEVRASDSDDDNIASKSSSDDSEEGRGKHVIREKKTEKTGWRTLTIRPALYEKVEVWNTPS